MGKTQQKRRKSRDFKRRGKDHFQSEPPRPQFFESVIQQLQSESSEDRECGLIAVGSFNQENAIEAVKNIQVLEIIGGLFYDSDVNVAALRAVESLCRQTEEFPKGIVQLIVLPLCDVLLTFSAPWTPKIKSWQENLAIDSKTSKFIAACELVSNLAQRVPRALSVFNSKDIVRLLLNHLDIERFGEIVAFHSLHSLGILSEDNPPGCAQIVENHSAILFYLQPLDDRIVSLNVSSIAFVILFNTIDYDVAKIDSAHLHQLIDVLQKILSFDYRKMIHEFSSMCSLTDQQLEPGEDKSDKELKAYFEIHLLLNATSFALEIINNLAVGSRADYSEDEDMEKSDEEDDGDLEVDGGVRREPKEFLVPLSEAFSKFNWCQKILEKTLAPAANVIDILRSQRYGGLVDLAADVQYDALNCFDSLVQELPVENLGGEEGLFKLWVDLGKKCFTGEGDLTSDAIYISSAFKIIRGVTQKFWEAKNGKFFEDLTVEDVQKMIEVAKSSIDQESRLNIVNTVGMIGYLLRGTKPDLMNTVVEFLMETAAKDTSVRVIGEALDSLMDLLAEDITDDYVAAIGLVPRLKQIMPGLKVKIARHISSQSQDTLCIGFIHEVRKNLMRFIKYKEKSPIIRVALVSEKNSIDK